MQAHRTILSLGCFAAAVLAQSPCSGNGVGNGYISTTPAYVGNVLEIHVGSPTLPNGLGLLIFSTGASPLSLDCFDVGGFILGLAALLDASGDAEFNFAFGPGTYGLGPIYAKAILLEPGGVFGYSKTVRVSVEHPNSTAPLPAMAGARSLHTVTPFEGSPRDNRTGALVAGGAIGSMIQPVAVATTQRFDSLSRSWTNGPNLTVARCSHGAVRLLDGRILIAGGMTNSGGTSTGGPATTHCEIYDPVTNAFSPTGSLAQPRSALALTQLLDGRVLASGGFTDWTDAGPNFAARLGTAQATTEIWSPTTGVWTAGPTMSSPRAGHTATVLANGSVLLVCGVSGGAVHLISGFGTIQVPVFTSSCERFDPATNQLSAAGSVLARGFHGASRLPNGSVLVTGGAAAIGTYGDAAATNTCVLYDPASNQWSSSAPLPTGVAFHSQVAHPISGAAWIAGGYVGGFANLATHPGVVTHDGVAATNQAQLGTNPGLLPSVFATGAHAAAVQHDGTMLLTGGYSGDTLTTHSRALLLIAP